MEKVEDFVILAAGQGSKFVREGEPRPKPMVEINGRPMIGRLISVLMECGARRIYVVTNPAMTSLDEELRRLRDHEGLPLVIRPLKSDNSFTSLRTACEGIPGRFVAMTCDTVFPTPEFRTYLGTVARAPENAAVMCLTGYVDDESPLYARLSDDGTEITDYHYGSTPFEGRAPIVSAGIYALTPALVAAGMSGAYPESLSDFQRILANRPDVPVLPFMMSKVIDVDCRHDRLEAERFLRSIKS